MMNRAAVNFGGYGTTLLSQATAPSQFSAYPNALPTASSRAQGLADQAEAGTLSNIVPLSYNYANPAFVTNPNSWVWGAVASGQGVNVGGEGNIFFANSKGGSPGYTSDGTGVPGPGAQTAAQFQAQYGAANTAQDAAQDAPDTPSPYTGPGYTQPGQGYSMPGQNFNQPNMAFDNVAPAGSTPGDTGGVGQSSQTFQTQYGAANAAQDAAQDAPDTSGSTYTLGSAPTGGAAQGVGVNGTAYDAQGNYVGYVSSADTYVPNNASTPNMAADNVAPAGSTPGDTGGMGQASQTAGGDYPSGVSGGLGPDYFSGGNPSADPSGAAQAPTNQAPPTGDILGFNDPSQTFTMPQSVDTPNVEASQAQSDQASGDQTVPQAVDKGATVEAKAIAAAATANAKATTTSATAQDKTMSAIAQQAVKSAQSIATQQAGSAKEQTASNQAASQTMLSQVKDLFVRAFLGFGGLVLIAAAVWFFAGRPAPPTVALPKLPK
jgi:hypothetical protein